MRYLVITFCLLAVVVFAARADAPVSSFSFVTPVQTIDQGVVSEKMTVSTLSSSGDPVAAGRTVCLKFSSSSTGGEFSSSKENWEKVEVVTMASNWTSRSFYYKDSGAGTHTLKVEAALRPDGESRSCNAWPFGEWSINWTATQNITIRGVSSVVGSSTQSSLSPQQIMGIDFSPARSMKAYAGEDRVIAAGSVTEFLGIAFGLDDKPLENARFWWNFGDGESKEGRSVSHIFGVPGEYTVGLHVSSSVYAASDYLSVKVVPNKAKIAGVISGEAGFVKILNPDDYDIDIGGWAVEDGVSKFIIPWRTKVKSRAEIALPNAVTGLFKTSADTATLRYPNSGVAFLWLPAVLEEQVIQKRVEAVQFKKPVEPEIEKQGPDVKNTALPNDSGRNEFAEISSSRPSKFIFLFLAVLVSLVAGIGFFLLKRYAKT